MGAERKTPALPQAIRSTATVDTLYCYPCRAADNKGKRDQLIMQHKDYTTTHRYINMARQMNQAVEKLYVPDLRKKGAS